MLTYISAHREQIGIANPLMNASDRNIIESELKLNGETRGLFRWLLWDVGNFRPAARARSARGKAKTPLDRPKP